MGNVATALALPARLVEKIEFTESCWLWTGGLRNGYGQVWWREPGEQRRICGAHRLVYELLIGLIPAGLELDHLCRVRRCVNPDHLDPVPHRTNVLRGVGPTSVNAVKTHCPHGHVYDAANGGQRICTQCQAAARERFADRAARLKGRR